MINVYYRYNNSTQKIYKEVRTAVKLLLQNNIIKGYLLKAKTYACGNSDSSPAKEHSYMLSEFLPPYFITHIDIRLLCFSLNKQPVFLSYYWDKLSKISEQWGKTNLSHDGLNPAHVPFRRMNNPTI